MINYISPKRITVQNQAEENKYIKAVSVNGKVLSVTVIKHADILNGGEMAFVMMGRHGK